MTTVMFKLEKKFLSSSEFFLSKKTEKTIYLDLSDKDLNQDYTVNILEYLNKTIKSMDIGGEKYDVKSIGIIDRDNEYTTNNFELFAKINLTKS